MADIFISHSGKDNEVAAAIGDRIRRERPSWSLFYDKDNIRAGQLWQERLREELQSCRIVLALLTRSFLTSPWCFTEAVTAAFRGTDVVAIEIEDLTNNDLAGAPPVLHERQRVRLWDGDDTAWQELLEALDRSGLDPRDWFPIPPDLGPYPGLVAFDEKHAGVFFGRKQEITEYLGILDTLRGPDRSQVLVISGASGSGKSSLLRAGLIPRLRRKPVWVVISPLEVAREPVRNLLDRLGEAFARLGISTHALDLTKLPDNPSSLVQILDEALRRLEQATGAWVLLPLDQAEALVTGVPGDDPATLLLDALAQILARRTRHAVVVATIRTEFVPRLEAFFAGSNVRLRQAPLSGIVSLAEVIEKPADRFGLELEPGLSERIVEDVQTADALPLMAYTLKELSDHCGPNRRLTCDDYRTLGGVRGAIAAKLALVLSDPEPTAEEAGSLRRAFTRYLIRVDEDAVEGERLLRRVAPRASLPRSADRLIGRLVDAGLLTAKDGTIELAHERVIGDWPKLPLNTWLVQDVADRRLIDQLRQRLDDDTLPDALFSQAEELLQRDHQLAVEEPALEKLVQRSRDERRARERRRRFVLGGVALVALVFAVIAWSAWLQRREAINQTQLANIAKERADENANVADTATKQAQVERDRARVQLLAMQARRAALEADTPNEIELAGALALESIALARKMNLPTQADAIEASRDALVRLPLQVLSQGSRVRSLAVLADGRLASGGEDGQIKLWPMDGQGEPVVLSQGSSVLSLALLLDGRLATGGEDGQIKLWPMDGHGAPVVLSQGNSVQSLAVLADGRLASGGFDGTIKLWPKDGQGEPAILSHGSPVEFLAVLTDGRLVSGGEFKEIKLWPRNGVGEPLVLPHENNSARLFLSVLADGRLASGDFDGQITLWPQDGVGEPVVLAQGSSVWSLAILADGRLASGGLDGQIRLWPKDGHGAPVVLYQGISVQCLAVLADGRLASGGFDGTIKLWPPNGVGEPTIHLHNGSVLSLAVLADGRLASGGSDGTIRLWPKAGQGEPVVLSQGSWVLSLAVLPDGRLAGGDADGKIKLWPKDGQGEPVVLSQGSSVWSLAVLADGRLADGKINLWPKDGQGEPVILTHGSRVLSLVALADGQLVSGGEDGRIKLWPRDAVEALWDVQADDSGWVWTLVVLRDGRLATGSFDGRIKLWPREVISTPLPRPGAHISFPFLRHASYGSSVESLAVFADGRLASGGDDGQIKLWPKEGTGGPVLLRHGDRIRSLAVLADGRLVSGGYDGQIKLWLVDERQLTAALCLRAGRNLTKDEWFRYVGSDTPWQPSCRDLPSNWRTPRSPVPTRSRILAKVPR
jgi:WD40 repeat protein